MYASLNVICSLSRKIVILKLNRVSADFLMDCSQGHWNRWVLISGRGFFYWSKVGSLQYLCFIFTKNKNMQTNKNKTNKQTTSKQRKKPKQTKNNHLTPHLHRKPCTETYKRCKSTEHRYIISEINSSVSSVIRQTPKSIIQTPNTWVIFPY